MWVNLSVIQMKKWGDVLLEAGIREEHLLGILFFA